MKPRCVLLLSALYCGIASAAESLQCNVGPIQHELGGTMWQVTSCDDGHSLVFATMADNPAMPFVFIIQRGHAAPQINGEGNGSKKHSAAAFKELKSMTEAEFDELVEATKRVDATK
jgi:hypothetical protein